MDTKQTLVDRYFENDDEIRRTARKLEKIVLPKAENLEPVVTDFYKKERQDLLGRVFSSAGSYPGIPDDQRRIILTTMLRDFHTQILDPH